MARSETHRRQRGKNLFVLALLVAFVLGMFYLTTLKMSGA